MAQLEHWLQRQLQRRVSATTARRGVRGRATHTGAKARSSRSRERGFTDGP